MSTNPYRVEEIPQARRDEASPRRWVHLVVVAVVSAVLASGTTWYLLTRHGLPPPAASSVTAGQGVTPLLGPTPTTPSTTQQGD